MWDKGKRFLFQKVLLSVVAAICLFPFIFLIIRAFLLDGFSLRQFESVLLYDWRFYVWFWNSLGYTVAILAIHIPVSVLAAYGFSQFDFPGKRFLFFLYILLMLLPFQATVLPQYLILNRFGMLDTRWAEVLPNGFNAFGVFFLTQFMKGIEPGILEASKLDGAGQWAVLTQIILPLCRPAVIALIVLQTFTGWALMDQPLLFLRREEILPLSLELGSDVFGENVFAAGLIFAIPPVLVYRYCRDSLVKGLQLSGIRQEG